MCVQNSAMRAQEGHVHREEMLTTRITKLEAELRKVPMQLYVQTMSIRIRDDRMDATWEGRVLDVY